jgi:type 1 glutamine amidotransferase
MGGAEFLHVTLVTSAVDQSRPFAGSCIRVVQGGSQSRIPAMRHAIPARSGLVIISTIVAWLLAGAAYSPPAASRPHAATGAPSSQPATLPKVLIFSKTAGFRHDAIPDGIEAIRKLGAAHRFAVDATEDAAAFADANLRGYRAIIFLNTTGDVLDATQQQAMEHFIHAGGGFVGIHSATDTEYDWPWYTQLVGAQFDSHPKVQQATVKVTDREHISTKHLPEKWTRTDEWYNFRASPTEKAGGRLRILAVLDESSYEGGSMHGDHPIAWCQEFDGGRAWYTEMGHTKESYHEENYLQHILGGIEWAMGVEK